jgi:hypothetical protein
MVIVGAQGGEECGERHSPVRWSWMVQPLCLSRDGLRLGVVLQQQTTISYER